MGSRGKQQIRTENPRRMGNMDVIGPWPSVPTFEEMERKCHVLHLAQWQIYLIFFLLFIYLFAFLTLFLFPSFQKFGPSQSQNIPRLNFLSFLFSSLISFLSLPATSRGRKCQLFFPAGPVHGERKRAMCDFGPRWQSGQETGVAVIRGHQKQLTNGATWKGCTVMVWYSVLVRVCFSGRAGAMTTQESKSNDLEL